MAASDPARLIRELYRGVDGFEITRDDEKRVRASKGNPLYGEIRPAGVARLIKGLALGPGDVFYDLGSGTGKVVVQVALTCAIKKCVGVELSVERTRAARRVVERARAGGHLRTRSVVLRQQDLIGTYLADATVVYSCSTAFSNRFMRLLMKKIGTLRRPITFASLQELPDHRQYKLRNQLRLDMTWKRRSPVYIYDTVPG